MSTFINKTTVKMVNQFHPVMMIKLFMTKLSFVEKIRYFDECASCVLVDHNVYWLITVLDFGT